MSAASSTRSRRRVSRSKKKLEPCKRVTTVIDCETNETRVLFKYGPPSRLVMEASARTRSNQGDDDTRGILHSDRRRFVKAFGKVTEHVVDKYGFCTECKSRRCEPFVKQGTIQMVLRSNFNVDRLFQMVNDVDYYPTAFFSADEYAYNMILDSFGFASDCSLAYINERIPPDSYFECKDGFSEFQRYHIAANVFRRADTSEGRHPYAFIGMPLWHRLPVVGLHRAHEMFMYVRNCAKRNPDYPDAYDPIDVSELEDYCDRLERISTYWSDHYNCPQQLAMYLHYVVEQTNNYFMGVAVVNMMTQINLASLQRVLSRMERGYGPLMDLGVFSVRLDVDQLNFMFPCLHFVSHPPASYIVAPGTSQHNLDVAKLELYTPLPTVLCNMVIEYVGGPVTIDSEFHDAFQPFLKRKTCYVSPEEVAYYFALSQEVCVPDKFPTRIEFGHKDSNARFCCTSVQYGNQSVLVPLGAYQGIERAMFAGFMPKFQNGVLYFHCSHVIPSMTKFSVPEV